MGRGATAAIVGGTASVIGGGKFANGAVTAAFVYAFNARGGVRRGGRGQSLSPGRAAREAANPNLRGGLDYGPSRRGELAPLPRDRSLVPLRFPTGDGFLGTPRDTILRPGTLVDRYGENTGRFLAPAGTSFGQRSLPQEQINARFQTFEVLQPLPVQAGVAVPWFGQQGLGTQYRTGSSIQNLLNQGFLRKVD